MEPHQLVDDQRYSDVWRQVFSAWIEFDDLDMVSEYNWSFSNLEDAFKEGGVLHEKQVYLFMCLEICDGQAGVSCIPAVVAIVSPFPPSNKVGIISGLQDSVEIIDMEELNLDWVPYIPPGEGGVVEGHESRIFILSCVERRDDLEQRLRRFLPYFENPFKEIVQSSIVDIMYPCEPKPVVYEFDWQMDELEELTNELIATEDLPEDQKCAFKEFVREKVGEAKRANREAREMQIQARDEQTQEQVAAYENMRFYKFYPVPTPDTPDVSEVKSLYINRFYGKAHQVL